MKIRDIENICRRVIKQRLPHDIPSMVRAIAKKEINVADNINSVTFETSDATPFSQLITGFPENGVGIITWSLMAGLTDASDSMLSKQVHGIRNEGGVMTVETSETALTTYTGGSLTGATVSGTADGNDFKLEFTGLAATEIQGKFTWSVEFHELVYVAP